MHFWPATPSRVDRQAQTAVLIDLLQEIQPPTIGGGVEPNVHVSDRVRVFGLVTPK